MKQQTLRLMGVLVAMAVVSPLSTAIAGQAPAPTLKTSWGEPDLQGLWSADEQVPLQRTEKNKGKEFYTDAEMAEMDRLRAVKPGFGAKRAERGTERDVAGAYDSDVFLTRRHTGRRTS